MDKRITVRFFKITQLHETAPPFEAALRQAFQSGNTPVEREQTVDGDAIIRLEYLEENGDYLDGEVVRRQASNFPPEATDEGLAALPLSDGAGLGHPVAFRYHSRLRVIAIQFDNRAVSLGKFLTYLNFINPDADYRRDILVRHDAWERYERGTPRKLILKVANPTNLPAVEGDVTNAAAESRRLSEVYHAPYVNIELSMGRRSGYLAHEAVDQVVNFFTRGEGRESDVEKLAVNVQPDDGSAGDLVNFIEETLKEQDTLELPDHYSAEHYEMRKNFIRSCFSEHLDHIRRVYGDG